MTTDRLQKILAAFADKRVLVVGDVMLDRYVHGRVERLNPEAPVPVLHAGKQEDMTGGAGNVAKNAASLGASAVLVAVVGADDTAAEVQTAAIAEGYSAKLVVDATRPTTRKVRYIVGAQQLLRVDWEETPDIAKEIEKQILTHVEENIATGVDALVVSDYAKGTITAGIARELLKLAKKHDLPLAADVKPSRVAYFKGASMIAPNVKEAHEYLGLNHLTQGGRDVAELAEQLHTEFDTDVFLTMGAGGVYVHTRDGIRQHVPQEHTIAVADTSGAGDTSLVAMLLAQLAGASAVEMAEISNAAGAVVVSKVGAVGVTLDELRSMLLHEHGD